MQKKIQEFFPKRSQSSHKFKNGYLTVFAGSKRYPGSARLAAHAAARVGAGGVISLIPESLVSTISTFYPEIIVWQLKEHAGVLTHATAFETFDEAQQKSSALLIGCGIDREPETFHFMKNCLTHTGLPIVIDGDGINGLSTFGEEFIKTHSKGKWILTPHKGEIEKLLLALGYEPQQTDLSELAKQWQCTLLLKGFPSKVYLQDGMVYTNSTGNPAASTAGCGDVLAGIIAGFLAQGLSPDNATCLGIYVAGIAADKYVHKTRSHSLLASDIIKILPKVLREFY